jgi:hypothetical protein
MPRRAMVANRHEPETYADLEALPEYGATRDIFKQAGWEPFLKKFDGYNDAITLQFALHFEGGTAKVGELEFEVTEEFIAEAIQLPTTGQRWTKGQPVDKKLCAQLLKPQYRETKWSEGTSRSWLEPQWAQVLVILQRYLTCEGRYTIIFPCHARLLLHFTGTPLNIPFFLLKSLKRMVEQVQRVSEFRGSLFHFGLVKILITSALSKKQETWDLFTVKTLACAQSKAKNVKPGPPHKKLNSKKKKVKTLTKDHVGDPEPEPPIDDEVETNTETGKATTPTEVNIEVPSSPPAAENIIDVEELAESTDKPRRNPKRKCKSVLSGMDNSVPSYPPQERLESIDGHEEAPEPSEMTWTLSQLIRKNRKTNRQATTPKGNVQNKSVQVPTGTPVQMPREFTPEPDLVDTSALSPAHPDPIDNYELSPDRNFDPVDTYERSPDAFTPEFSSDHSSDRFHTPAQSPEEPTHASSPSPQPGQGQTVETHCEISSSRSLKPVVAKLESKNSRLKEKLHEYIVLDRHIKTENELLKLRVTHLLSKIERLKQRNKDIFKRNRQLQRIARKHVIINRVLKKEIRNLKKQERLQMLVAAAATL